MNESLSNPVIRYEVIENYVVNGGKGKRTVKFCMDMEEAIELCGDLNHGIRAIAYGSTYEWRTVR